MMKLGHGKYYFTPTVSNKFKDRLNKLQLQLW